MTAVSTSGTCSRASHNGSRQPPLSAFEEEKEEETEEMDLEEQSSRFQDHFRPGRFCHGSPQQFLPKNGHASMRTPVVSSAHLPRCSQDVGHWHIHQLLLLSVTAHLGGARGTRVRPHTSSPAGTNCGNREEHFTRAGSAHRRVVMVCQYHRSLGKRGGDSVYACCRGADCGYLGATDQ